MARIEQLISLARFYYKESVEALRDYERRAERIFVLERLAQLLIQIMLEIGAILASKDRGVKPGTYRELAAYLAERMNLSNEDKAFLEGLAGFKNILVYLYAGTDQELEEKAFREIAEKMPRILNTRYTAGEA